MVNMAIIYAACVAGAVGLLIALPRRGSRLAPLGIVIGAGALGAGFLALIPPLAPIGKSAAEDGPGVFFYILAFIAAGGAMRMVTHARPVYAALYFILVVLSTAGLFVMLSAEFMAFALIIVYAGAILVTYLFVIMLAQEAPDEDDLSSLTEYDANANEPVSAVMAGFLLLAVLLGVAYRGITPSEAPWNTDRTRIAAVDTDLALLPGKVERALVDADVIPRGSKVTEVDSAGLMALVSLPAGERALFPIPDGVETANVETIGLSLFVDFPVTLELAGVILFMAMLGAVVLARKQSRVLNVAATTVAQTGDR